MKDFKKCKYVLLYDNIEPCYDEYITEDDNLTSLMRYGQYLKTKDDSLIIVIVERKKYEIGIYKPIWSI